MIPKLIHFIWIQGSLYENNAHIIEYHRQMIKELGPEWEIKIWTGFMLESLIMDVFPSLLCFYHETTIFAQKSDIGRIVILYIYGGIYLDVDRIITCKRRLELLCEEVGTYGVLLPIYEQGEYTDIINFAIWSTPIIKFTIHNNNIIFATPNHPFLHDALLTIQRNRCRRTLFGIRDLYVLQTTGPVMLTRLMLSSPLNYNISSFYSTTNTFLEITQPIDRVIWIETNISCQCLTYLAKNVNILFLTTFSILIIVNILFVVFVVKQRSKRHKLHLKLDHINM